MRLLGRRLVASLWVTSSGDTIPNSEKLSMVSPELDDGNMVLFRLIRLLECLVSEKPKILKHCLEGP